MMASTSGMTRIDRAALERHLERLEIPADLKALLAKLLETTIRVGEKLVDLGARVLAFILDFAKAYPGITFGVVVALVLAYLISSVPVVGPVLSPILTPLLLIVGIGAGALDDLTDGGMRARLQALQLQLKTSGVT
jgi:hypothetical protein